MQDLVRDEANRDDLHEIAKFRRKFEENTAGVQKFGGKFFEVQQKILSQMGHNLEYMLSILTSGGRPR